MNRNIRNIIIVFFLSNLSIFAQIDIDSIVENGRKESLWKGFKRYDFKYKQRDARLIVPSHPLSGNPWIWRARFPDWHTDADSILVSEGFHLAYINTNDKYGSPSAIKIWDDFYDFLITDYKLQEKVALIGVSRGGLFVYNWAKKNLEKVACIYAEAPVCDFKSWPAGFGESEGSLNDWKKLKEEYGFVSDDEAKLYSNNPIDSLEALAEAKVPILHMIGLKDKIVPVDENTFPLINKYLKLGGNASVVTCTKGIQELEGHHFPIETPRLVADFIKYHSLNNLPLDASNYHQEGSGLKNSQIKFERNKTGRVAFLGGSITHNSGWRDSICNYLVKRFPETTFEFIAAGIPSMGTTPAAFRLERDVLSHGKVDLLFEEAAVNDASNGRTKIEQIRGMEGIVRHLRKSNSEIDIVMMHFVDPDKIASYSNSIEPDVISNHNKVAKHYNIPIINLAKEVTDRINNNEFTWNNDFKNIHPSPFGQGIYANSMVQFLNNAYSSHIDSDDKILSYNLPIKIDDYSYDNGYLLDITAAKLNKSWIIDSLWKPKDGANTRPNYVNSPMLIGNYPGKALKLKFEGNSVGIAVAAGPDAGVIEYRVDKKEWTTLNLFTKWSMHLHLPWYYTLATGLSSNEHLLEIRITETKDERSIGRTCRIRYFYTNRY
ncbi:SGNH/GDSL hydrolase family protein [Confluentibacter flavum]|uniref:SGNH/GDSL hydrolase family protein n=1 Tax=Confluentibacter flavum TaxID=1909700 RepID=A0A2N3HNI3_9FLAO|nr:GDSL-type esterase/lipase family protein [Confluentibacter flavum]PKQ46516.1 SGNH/GDSL hydrolase family protein [Confluentibacter flavum]